MELIKKGFTMVELLAAVTLLGIISAIAVVAYSRYQAKVREGAYEAMEKSALSAAQTYIAERGIIVPVAPSTRVIEISTLVDTGFLNNLEDPRAKGDMCHTGSKVEVSKTKNSGTTPEEYTYIVTIKCNGYTSSREDAAGNKLDGKLFKS